MQQILDRPHMKPGISFLEVHPIGTEYESVAKGAAQEQGRGKEGSKNDGRRDPAF